MALAIPTNRPTPTYSTVGASWLDPSKRAGHRDGKNEENSPTLIRSMIDLGRNLPCLVRLTSKSYLAPPDYSEVLRIDTEGYSGPDRDRSGMIDITQPLFLYKSILYGKVRAKCFSRNPFLPPVSHDIIIPESYNGWFRFQREDGQSAVCLNTVEQLAFIDPKYILNDSDICGYYHDEDLTSQYLPNHPKDSTKNQSQPLTKSELSQIVFDGAISAFTKSSRSKVSGLSEARSHSETVDYAKLRTLKETIRTNLTTDRTSDPGQGSGITYPSAPTAESPYSTGPKIYVKRCVPRGSLLKNLGYYSAGKDVKVDEGTNSPVPTKLSSAKESYGNFLSANQGSKYIKCLIVSKVLPEGSPSHLEPSLPELNHKGGSQDQESAGTIVFLPFHRKGRFFVVGPPDCSSIDSVYPISAIAKRIKKPVLVKHVSGPLPKALTEPVGVQNRRESRVPTVRAKEQDLTFLILPTESEPSSTVLACSLDYWGNGKSLFELDVAQIDFGNMRLQLIADGGKGVEGRSLTYKKCLDFCQKNDDSFTRSIKIMHYVDEG